MEVIESARLLLRPWESAVLVGLTKLAEDRAVMRYIGSGETWTPDRIERSHARRLAHWADHGFGARAAIEKTTDTWVGFIALNHAGPEATELPPDEVEIGWWLAPSVWGRGLATEGALAARDEAFGRLALPRIVARYQPANVASGRIIERIGMRFERDSIGRHGDTVRICTLQRDEWLIASVL